MEKLVFGLNCDAVFYEDSLPTPGFGWLEVSAQDSGVSAPVRFWADGEKMRSFASAVSQQAEKPDSPMEVHWDDEPEGRTFCLKVVRDEERADLAVELEISRKGSESGERFVSRFETSESHLRAFKGGLVDLISQRRSRAALKGW